MSVSLSPMPNGGSPVRLPNIGLRGGQATRPQSVKRAIPRSTTKISSIEQIRPSSKSPSSLSPRMPTSTRLRSHERTLVGAVLDGVSD